MGFSKYFLVAINLFAPSLSLWSSLDNKESGKQKHRSLSVLNSIKSIQNIWTDIQCHVCCLQLSDGDINASQLKDGHICHCLKLKEDEVPDIIESNPEIFIRSDIIGIIGRETTESTTPKMVPWGLLPIQSSLSFDAATDPSLLIDGNLMTVFKSRPVESPSLLITFAKKVTFGLAMVYKKYGTKPRPDAKDTVKLTVYPRDDEGGYSVKTSKNVSWASGAILQIRFEDFAKADTIRLTLFDLAPGEQLLVMEISEIEVFGLQM